MTMLTYKELEDELIAATASDGEFLDALTDEISIHFVDNCSSDLVGFIDLLQNEGAQKLLAAMIGVPVEDLGSTIKEIITSLTYNTEIDITLFDSKAPPLEDEEDTELELSDAN